MPSPAGIEAAIQEIQDQFLLTLRQPDAGSEPAPAPGLTKIESSYMSILHSPDSKEQLGASSSGDMEPEDKKSSTSAEHQKSGWSCEQGSWSSIDDTDIIANDDCIERSVLSGSELVKRAEAVRQRLASRARKWDPVFFQGFQAAQVCALFCESDDG